LQMKEDGALNLKVLKSKKKRFGWIGLD